MTEHNTSTMQNLWNRRFFQYLATYLAASWGLIQFVEWIVNRYNFDSTWVDNIAIFLFAMLPAVASFIYVHGRPGHDQWRPFEKIFYPINFVIALAASFFLFNGSAQASTRQVEVTNLEGDTITRIVPSESASAEIVFFPFKINIKGEEWLRYGLPILLDKDIEQDMKWYATQPFALKEDYLDLGQQLNEDIPISNKIRIASDKYSDFFADGTVSKKDGMYELEIEIFNTSNGRSEKKTTVSGEDIYSLVDQANSFILSNFNNIELDNVERSVDLPAKDLISNDIEALKAYIEAQKAYRDGPQSYGVAFERIDQSVEIDPSCAECWLLKTIYDQVRGSKGTESIAQALNLSTTLPERQRFNINYFKYIVNEAPQKAIKLLDSWKKLYPSDVIPFDRLIGYYTTSFQFAEARKTAEEAVEKGHKGGMLLQAARLNIRNKDFEKAQEYVNEFTRLYPKKSKKTTVLAEVYIAKGEFEKAIPIYEEQSIMNPSAFGNQLQLAECYYKMNDFDTAEDYFDEALMQSNTQVDTLTVLNDRMQYYVRVGKHRDFKADLALHRKVFESINPPEAYAQVLLMNGAIDAAIGDTVQTEATKKEVVEIAPKFVAEVFGILADYLFALAYEDAEAYKAAYEKGKSIIDRSGEAGKKSSEAMLYFFNKEYDQALKIFKEFEIVAGTSILDNSDVMARCYINTDQVDEGLEYINDLLVGDPNHPIGLLSKAMLLNEKGRKKDLQEVISKLEVVYANAHPKWKYKLQIEDMKASLNES